MGYCYRENSFWSPYFTWPRITMKESFEKGSGRLPDLKAENLWLNWPFRRGIGSWGITAWENNGDTVDLTFCRTVSSFTYHCSVIHVCTLSFFSNEQKKVGSNLVRTGLWFLTQLVRHWLEQLLLFGSLQTCLALLPQAPKDRELLFHTVWAVLLSLLSQVLFTCRL